MHQAARHAPLPPAWGAPAHEPQTQGLQGQRGEGSTARMANLVASTRRPQPCPPAHPTPPRPAHPWSRRPWPCLAPCCLGEPLGMPWTAAGRSCTRARVCWVAASFGGQAPAWGAASEWDETAGDLQEAKLLNNEEAGGRGAHMRRFLPAWTDDWQRPQLCSPCWALIARASQEQAEQPAASSMAEDKVTQPLLHPRTQAPPLTDRQARRPCAGPATSGCSCGALLPPPGRWRRRPACTAACSSSHLPDTAWPACLPACRVSDPREPEAAAADAGLLGQGVYVPPVPAPLVGLEDR